MKRILLSAVAAGALMAPAFAADVVVEEIVEVAPAGYTWNGLYVGASIGWAWQDRDDNGVQCADGEDDLDYELTPSVLDALESEFGVVLDDPSPSRTCFATELGEDGTDDVFHIFNVDEDDDDDDNGWMASAFVGVNRQYGDFVVGTELEGVWLDTDEDTHEFLWGHQDNNDFDIDNEDLLAGGFASFGLDGPDWIAHGTVKAGWLFGSMQQTLFYLKGGFAAGDKQESRFDVEGFGGSNFELNSGVFLGVRGDSSEESGYGFGGTVGVGVEHKFTQNFSMGLEYQGTFLNYDGSHDVTFLVEEEELGEVRETTIRHEFEDVAIHAVKLKASWHFN